MNTLKLSEIIGQEITGLRYQYVQKNEYDLQTFDTYIKLSNNAIITIPIFDDVDFNVNSYTLDYNLGNELNTSSNLKVIGQKIEDIYFCYFENENDFDFSSFIKLSNGYYVTENRVGPIGLPNIDIFIYNENQFFEELKRLNKLNIEVRSFIHA